MRLSTEADRNDEGAIAVLHAALDAGVTFLDTADAYCRDAGETGHNERLIARALETWPGDRSRILVATKGGLTRPQGLWIPDGRARHLIAACEASRLALGVDRIALYQLHAPDPRTPLSTSIRALASLKEAGSICAIGLCNVTVGQIEEARAIAEIATVQVELNPWKDDALLNGVAGYCATNGIRLIAHRPLGGSKRVHRVLSDRVLVEVAARHGATPHDVVLAWLSDLSDAILPIPGPTRVETARAIARAREIRLTGQDRAQLDERFPSGQVLRRAGVRPVEPRPRTDGELVLIMGLPAAGKSTVARTLVERGFARLNRDESGLTLRGLLPAIDRLVDSGCSRIVLDNTYMSRKSRAAVVHAAAKRGLPVRCIWVSTSLEDAQVNLVSRMLSKYGRLLGPEEMREVARGDPNVFAPGVQFRHQRELEPPDPAEGFSRIDVVPFERRRDPSFTNKAVILWCDGVLRRRRPGQGSAGSDGDEEILTGRGDLLRRYASDGWVLCGLAWSPQIAEESMTPAEAEAGVARMQDRLGVSLDVLYCPHAAGPPTCWCRKPLPGLGALLIARHRLDPALCVYVGAGPQDPGFARRLGFQYRPADEFFGVRS
jgi:aryl-alcohol dehydrogenase-like predicted oxidoreductase/predicted kinase